MFQHRSLLEGNHLSSEAYFLGATREPGEPTVLEGPTVWYRWTAPEEDGYLQVGAPGFIYPGIYVFEGTEVASLHHVLPFVAGVTKTHQVQGGKEYAIAVVSPGPNFDGTFTSVVCTLDFATGPVNDLLSTSKLVAGDLVETNELALGVTQQDEEPFPAVWWTWIAPADGKVNLLLNGGWNINFYGGTEEAPTLLWASPHPQTFGVIDVEAGKAYHIAVDPLTHERAGFQLQLERRLSVEGIQDGKIYRQGDTMDVTFGGVPEGEVITNLSVFISSLGPVLETNRMVPLHVEYLPAGRYLGLTAAAQTESGKHYYLPNTIFHVYSPQYFFGDLQHLTNPVVELSANMEGSPQNFAENIHWWRWTAPFSGIIHGEHLSGPGLNWALFKGTDPVALQAVPNWTVEAGSPYVIQASSIRSSGTYRFSILRTPPPNDLFANATVLDTSTLWEPVLVGSATADPGEEGTSPSVWYLFTAPTEGVMTFGAGGSPYFLATTMLPITVAKDAAIDELVPMTALNGDHQFAAEAGQTYRLRVQRGFENGNIPYIFFHFAPRIENDKMAEARVLAGDHLSFELVLAGAGSETNEPPNSIGLIPPRTAWYEWTAPYAGFVALRAPEVMGSDGPVVDLHVFGGEPLSPVPFQTLEGEARFFHAEEGTKYLLRFSDFLDLGTNRVTGYLDLSPIALEYGGPPKPVALEPIPLSLPDEAINAAALSIRYKVSEAHSGANRWSEWREITNIVAPPFDYSVTNLDLGNQTIYAVITNVNGTVSYLPPIELRMRPGNDDYANRHELSGRKVSWIGSTVNATLEPSEPAIGNPAADVSVWYTWTSPGVAPTTIKVAGENYLRVFEGDSLENLQPLPVLTPQQITFTPLEGRTYQIAVASVTTNPAPQHWTTFGLNLDMSPLTLLQPVGGTIFDDDEPIITTISTPERPEVIVNTEFQFAFFGSPIYVTNAPGFLPSVTSPWLPPGSYTVTASVKFDTGETMSRITPFRIRPRNLLFGNATVLEGESGTFRPTTLGADATPRRTTNWFRFRAETNGHLVISTTNTAFSSPPIGAIELKVTVGTEANALTAVPHIGNVQRDQWVAFPVTAETTYNLQFTIEAGRTLPALEYYVVPFASNDLFEDAEVISGTSAEVRVVTRFSTNQVGEPAHQGPATRTLWWKWESPAQPGFVTSSGRAKFYAGSELTNLTALPAVFYVAVPTVFYIVTEGPATQLESEWKFEFNPSPANDHFETSTVLDGRRALMDADLRYATGEPGEETVHPAGYSWGKTVWYRWTAPMDGQMVLRRLHDFPVVTVFRGTALTNLTLFQPTFEDIYHVEEGETLHISLDSASAHFPVIELLMMMPPSNDSFSNPLVLGGLNPTASSWNFGAGRELGEVHHNGQLGGRSVWFEWVAPEDGPVQVTLRGDISTNLLAVYRGESIGQLAPIASGSGALTNQVQFEADGGERYRIAADGAYGASGDFDISIELLTSIAPLKIASIEMGDGTISFKIEGGSAGAELQRSFNLVDWETIQTIIGVGQVEIDATAGIPAAFFRVVAP